MTFNIEVQHPDYKRHLPLWLAARDAHAGQAAVKREGTKYLPERSGMSLIENKDARDKAFKDYKNRAEFPEILAPTIQGLVGLIMSKHTKIELPSGLEYLRENATRDGLTLRGLHQRVLSEVFRTGRFGLLPGVIDGEFYLAGYTAEAIPNWDDENGELSYAVLDESGIERDPETNEWERVVRFLECYVGEGGFVTRKWVQSDAGWEIGEEIPAQDRAGNGLELFPMTMIGATDLTPQPDKAPMQGLVDLAYRAYRLDADFMLSLTMTAEPTPWVAGVQPQETPRAIGASQVWTFSDPSAKAEFLEFSGAGISSQVDAIDRTLGRAVTFGAQMFAEGKTAESGDAIRLRLGNQHATIKTVASTGASGLEAVLKNAAVWAGENPDDVSVEPDLDFVDHSLTAQDILALVSSWQAGAYSREVLFNNLQRGHVIDKSVDYDEELGRIDQETGEIALGG